jgi:hypothetical protein
MTNIFEAAYRVADLPEERGNPLLEAIPPFKSAEDVMRNFAEYPSFRKEERVLPKASRMLAVARLNTYFEPSPSHFEIIEQIGMLIHAGYVHRNPATAEYLRSLNEFYRQNVAGTALHQLKTAGPSTAPSFSLFGVSGVGKSTVVDRFLSFYPQAISHPKHGFAQLVWLKLDCPLDGSLKQLLNLMIGKIDHILGTEHAKVIGRRATVDELLVFVAKIAAKHHLGLLVVDEIQNLLDASGVTRAKMLNFFVTLSNEVKIPFVIMGTPKAQKLLGNVFRESRRLSASTTWDRMKFDNEWDFFLRRLNKYQWTSTAADFTKEFSEVMYDHTQGIRALVILLFQLSQLRAMRSKTEKKLTVDLIAQVAADQFSLLDGALAALRSGKKSQIEKFEDLLYTGILALHSKVSLEVRAPVFEDYGSDSRMDQISRTRMISSLVSGGCEQTLGISMADALFSNPEIAPDVRARVLSLIASENADDLIKAFLNARENKLDIASVFRLVAEKVEA